ncbi:MAG: hypothetical protein H0V82_00165 [Candidatus Protochlamydia sp.]|nr:hypothetical protein [Candidatus Protochlamydia sp.]
MKIIQSGKTNYLEYIQKNQELDSITESKALISFTSQNQKKFVVKIVGKKHVTFKIDQGKISATFQKQPLFLPKEMNEISKPETLENFLKHHFFKMSSDKRFLMAYGKLLGGCNINMSKEPFVISGDADKQCGVRTSNTRINKDDNGACGLRGSYIEASMKPLVPNACNMRGSGVEVTVGANLCAGRTSGIELSGGAGGCAMRASIVDITGGISACGARASVTDITGGAGNCGARASAFELTGGINSCGARASLVDLTGGTSNCGAKASLATGTGGVAICGANATLAEASLVSVCGAKVSAFKAQLAGAEVGIGIAFVRRIYVQK